MEDIKIGLKETPCEVEIKKNVFRIQLYTVSRAPLVILIPGFYNNNSF